MNGERGYEGITETVLSNFKISKKFELVEIEGGERRIEVIAEIQTGDKPWDLYEIVIGHDHHARNEIIKVINVSSSIIEL